MSRQHFFGARISTLSLLLVASGLLFLIWMFQHFVGPFHLAGAPPAAHRAVVLWLPAAADEGALETKRRLDAWERALPREARPRTARGVEELPRGGAAVVAVPDGRRASAAETTALLHFVEEGGALVLAGSVGVRDARGEWRGYELMRALLDVPEIVPLPGDQAGAVAPARRGPLSAALVPGDPVGLVAEAGVPAVADATAELVWGAADRVRGASRRAQLGRGRLAWLAPGPENVVGDSAASVAAVDAVIRAALAWTAGEPVVEVLPERALENAAVDPEAWRRLGEALTASSEQVGPRRLLVSVSNRSEGALRGGALRIYLAGELETAEVSPTLLRQEVPARVRVRDRSVELWLPPVPARTSRSWHIDWTPRESPWVARAR